MTSGAAPPGWYPDQSGTVRWWDGQAWGPTAPPPGPADEVQSGKALAVLSWLGFFVFYGLPALVVRIVESDRNRFARWHAAEAVNLQLTVLAIWLPVIVPFISSLVMMDPEVGPPAPVFLLTFLLGGVLAIGTAVLVILGAVRAGQGVWWRCPLAIPFLRRHRSEGHG